MFQYNSGGAPWLGIDLIPRKKSITKIDHRQSLPVKDQQAFQEPVNLADQKQTTDEQFQKKPLRLNLPASRESLQPTGFVDDAIESTTLTSHQPVF